MILLDANIFIYLGNQTLDSKVIASRDVAYATITKIEVLGYQRIQANELIELQIWFDAAQDIALSNRIIDRAVVLRQSKSMSLGDAITAATALEYELELWTANTAEFEHIDDLTLVNPLQP